MCTLTGLTVLGSTAQPLTRSPPRTDVTASKLPYGLPVRQGRWWDAVALSTRMAVPQAASVCHGGMHVTTRHTIGPRQAMFWWHCP